MEIGRHCGADGVARVDTGPDGSHVLVVEVRRRPEFDAWCDHHVLVQSGDILLLSVDVRGVLDARVAPDGTVVDTGRPLDGQGLNEAPVYWALTATGILTGVPDPATLDGMGDDADPGVLHDIAARLGAPFRDVLGPVRTALLAEAAVRAQADDFTPAKLSGGLVRLAGPWVARVGDLLREYPSAWSAVVEGRDLDFVFDGSDLDDIATAARGTTDMIRRLSGVNASDALLSRIRGRQERRAFDRLDFLAKLPLDWIPDPGDDDGWSALAYLVPAMYALAERTDRKPAELFSGSKGRWTDYAVVLRKAAGLPSDAKAGDLLGAAVSVADMMEAVVDEVVFPIFFGTFPMASAEMRFELGVCRPDVILLTATSGAASILERSTAWHRDRPGMRARMGGLSGASGEPVRWDPGLPDWTDPVTGTVFRVCRSVRDLEDEGAHTDEGLEHCVADYAWGCLEGTNRIVGLRGSDGRRTSTAQVVFRPVRVVQHLGRRNSEPTADDRASLARWIAHVDPMTPAPGPVHGLEVASYRRSRAGYDAKRPELVDAVLEMWRPYLERRHRKATRRDVLDVLPFLRAGSGTAQA